MKPITQGASEAQVEPISNGDDMFMRRLLVELRAERSRNDPLYALADYVADHPGDREALSALLDATRGR